MSTPADPRVARLHELLAAITERRFAASLGEVEAALGRWRAGTADTLATHQAVVAHAERADGIMRRPWGLAETPTELIATAAELGLVDADERAALYAAPLPPPGRGPDGGGVAAPPEQARGRRVPPRQGGRSSCTSTPASPGSRCPLRFASDAKLVLRFGYHLSPPISDLVIDDVGIAGTLVFAGVPFGCVLPWTAIFALIQDGESRGMGVARGRPGRRGGRRPRRSRRRRHRPRARAATAAQQAPEPPAPGRLKRDQRSIRGASWRSCQAASSARRVCANSRVRIRPAATRDHDQKQRRRAR
jgi:hypothetical protein